MCFDRDSSPPILAGTGRIGETGRIVLESADGTAFGAFAARPADPARATILVLPDVRGLHPYYEELTCRFAEHGFRALAIDYFGRTAGSTAERPEGFEYHEHVDRATYAGLSADVRSAVAHLRGDASGPERSLFTIGFCFGGRLSFLASTFGLELAGVIGVHAGLHPRNDLPPPVDAAGDMRAPVLGLFGGADPSVPPEAVDAFDAALTAAGVEHRFVTYAGAPHSFFDRKFDEFATQSAAAWAEVLDFLGATSATPA